MAHDSIVSEKLYSKKKCGGRQSPSSVTRLVIMLHVGFERHVPAVKVQDPGENLVLAHHGVILHYDDVLDGFNRLQVLTP